MLDVAIAPLLWRLDHYGIELSKNAAPLLKYAERIFASGVHRGADPSEKVMRASCMPACPGIQPEPRTSADPPGPI